MSIRYISEVDAYLSSLILFPCLDEVGLVDRRVLLCYVPGQQQDRRGQENYDQSIHVS